MIATIKKVPIISFLQTIEYNEQKVREGEGERLINTTMETSPKEMLYPFQEQLNKNSRVNKNQIAKIVISFSPEDTPKINRDMLLQSAHEVFNGMGYEGTTLAYYHTDKDHHHLHLYSTTVDVKGHKIKEYEDYVKLEMIMRQIESKHNLKVVQEDQSTSIALGEVQAKEYAIHQALVQNPQFYEKACQLIRQETLREFLERPQTNGYIMSRVGDEFGKQANEQFKQLFTSTDRKRFFKDLLINHLDRHLTVATSNKDYFNRLSSDNLYARIIYGKRGKPHISYGITDQAFYVKENTLPSRFSLGRINEIGKTPDPVAHQRKEQRKFIRNQVFKSLRVSSSLFQLENSLYLNGVRLITHSNANGVYGVSFESLNISNPISFKGSEIDRSLSFNKIRDRIKKNSPAFDSSFYDQMADSVKERKHKAITQPSTPNLGKLARKLETDQDREDRARRAGYNL